jgi:hypothetical protein
VGQEVSHEKTFLSGAAISKKKKALLQGTKKQKEPFRRAQTVTKNPSAGHEITVRAGHIIHITTPLGSENNREPFNFPPCLTSALKIEAYVPTKRWHHTTRRQCVSYPTIHQHFVWALRASGVNTTRAHFVFQG